MEKNYWIIAREYAGLAEAGGVKNVVRSLAEGFNRVGWPVTVIMPLYGCTAVSSVIDFDIIENTSIEIEVGDKLYRVVFSQGYFNGIRIVFIVNASFTSKMGVYTYTRLEEALYPNQKSGEGHIDANIISILFQKSVIEFGIISGERPDVLHCQDSHTALIPFLINHYKEFKEYYKNTKFVITIHNAGTVYRDQCESLTSASMLLNIDKNKLENYCVEGKPEPFLLSQEHASFTTVSPWYAEELLSPDNAYCSDICIEFSKRAFKIIGITNGIDYSYYNPENAEKSKIPFSFNPLKADLVGKKKCLDYFLSTYNTVHTRDEAKKIDRVIQHGILSNENTSEESVYFSFHGRLVHQKGIEVLVEAAKLILESRENARFIVIGQGTSDFEKANIHMAHEYFGKYLYFQGYDKALSRLCIAVSDFLVLPSFFEPCGLQDFIAQIYGAIPVAHACGGLNKIIDNKTGFLYKKNDAVTLSYLLNELIDRKKTDKESLLEIVVKASNYVFEEYSWDKIIREKYIPLFLSLI